MPESLSEKMNKKMLLARVLFKTMKSVFLPVFSSLRPKDFIYILAYHRIFSFYGKDYPFSEGTISATPDEFDKQMEFVKGRFNVINFDMLSHIIASKKPLPKNSLIITFDDGYADNYEIAWGILNKYEMTATIFLATSFIDSSNLFWFDKLSYIMNHLGENPINLGEYIVETGKNRRKKARDSVMKILRSVSEKDRVRLFNELEKQCNVPIPSEHTELAKPLTWSQIQEMSESGIEFGSHTATHPFLSNLTKNEIMYEFVESKRVIENRLKKEVKVVAYPDGSYDKRVVNCAKICGFQFGVSYEHNVKGFNENELFTIPRIHVETGVDYYLFQANLLLPQIFVKYGV